MHPKLSTIAATCCAAAIIAACTAQQPQTTPTIITSTSSGEVGYPDEMSGGMWIDGAGGMWMDTTGSLRIGGAYGTPFGLTRAMVDYMTNENIVAHLSAGDSLEVALSALGVQRATRSQVRDFAQRMVNEHAAHMRMALQSSAAAQLMPMQAPGDTATLVMTRRMMVRLQDAPAGDAFDRQLMRAEIMMHRHMLNELTMVQPRATGTARSLVDQTIPVVTAHLADARRIWMDLGGRAGGR